MKASDWFTQQSFNGCGLRTQVQTFDLSENATAVMTSDVDEGGRKMDTAVDLTGRFVIAGADCERFRAELSALIEKYRI